MSWPQSEYAPQASTSGSLLARVAGVAGVLLIVGGAAAVGVAVTAQEHAPQPFVAAAGAAGPSAGNARGPSLQRSLPVSVDIPAIGVHSKLLHLGVNSDGTIQIPSLYARPGAAAWFKYSATPGQIGASVIEGHLDGYHGPAVFFRLGALRPGDSIEDRKSTRLNSSHSQNSYAVFCLKKKKKHKKPKNLHKKKTKRNRTTT